MRRLTPSRRRDRKIEMRLISELIGARTPLLITLRRTRIRHHDHHRLAFMAAVDVAGIITARRCAGVGELEARATTGTAILFPVDTSARSSRCHLCVAILPSARAAARSRVRADGTVILHFQSVFVLIFPIKRCTYRCGSKIGCPDGSSTSARIRYDLRAW